MQDSSAFQFLAIDTIHESTTNPRRTFEESKLHELAHSIRQHGLIQPITVRPNADGFEIVAGARRFRAAQLAELFSIPARIVDIDDTQALEWQLVENALRADVHPYEEAQGFERLLNMPGYDVSTLAEKTGKSASHIYARLSLMQLIPAVAEAFTDERISASHANLIARLPRESQAAAFEQCWRKDWQDKEAHLLPARHIAAWIEANLYLSLADAPFDREDPALNPSMGACSTCSRRTGYNTALFADAVADECLDGGCFQVKVSVHIERQIAARPDLVQIENGFRSSREQTPGAVRRGHYREIETAIESPHAESVSLCAAAKPAIIVYGKRAGTTLTVCTDDHCPVHDPRAAAAPQTTTIAQTIALPPAVEKDEEREEAEERQRNYEQQQKAYEQEREQRAEERRLEEEREEQEHKSERAQMEETLKARTAIFDRILANAPPVFNAAQLGALLRALLRLDPYTFVDDVAEHFVGGQENHRQTAEEILLSALNATVDDKLTCFALRLVLTSHIAIPREGEIDFLAEAETVFVPPLMTKTVKTPAPVHKKNAGSKKSAA